MSEKARTIMLGFHSRVDGRLMREWLMNLNYKVVESLDDTGGIDLVLMDSISARRLMDKTFKLKKAAKYFLPVLVCINAGEEVGRWLNAGFDDVIRLPATKDEWQARIAIMLRLRRQSEELGQKSEYLHRALIESSSDHIFLLDANGAFVTSNDRVSHFGFDGGTQLVGKTIEQVFPQTVAPFYRKQVQRVLTDGKTVVFEYELPTNHGVRYHLDTLYTLKLPDGTTMVGGICRDITERKQAEKERAALQEQLRQAQKLESIGRLAGGVAHDFNNMLSVILGYGEILLAKLHERDPMRDKIREIVKAGHRAEALTRQLLAFSRKQTLQPQVLDLNEQVRNLVKMLRRLIGENITLNLELAENLPPVLFDPGQLDQVIINLAVNSRDAMPEGGELLIETSAVQLDEAYVAAHNGTSAGKYVLLAVSDTGCGMDKEISEKIFEPFFTTKERGKGTGLGLSTVYGIVKQSGGNIWVYSEPGKGTTFKIYIPQTEEKREPREELVESEKISGSEHVLVVEDEDTLRDLIKSALTNLGYSVTLAANGGEALLLMEKKGLKPDLVITDVIMPNMGGKELIDRLRRTYPNLRALFMSGYTDNAIVHNGVLDQDTPFLQKPFTIQELGKKVREVLAGKHP